MKKSKILLTTMAVLGVLVMAGCGGNGSNQAQDPPPREPDTAARQVQDNTQVQDFAHDRGVVHAHNVSIINTTHDSVAIDPMALPIEEAARVGLEYVREIFGHNTDGMYVELEFSDWDHMTRTLWQGTVSANNRNTLANRAGITELNAIFSARLEAGEDSEDIFADMADMFLAYNYVPGRFTFFIDGITGQRIDIWQTTTVHTRLEDESIPLHEFIEQEWGGDWTAAFEIEIDPQVKEELGLVAMMYAQLHFNTSAVVDIRFEVTSVSFIYNGGGFDRDPSAIFVATDDTGREAHLNINIATRTLLGINTMVNDFIPMDLYEFDGGRAARE